MSLLPHLRLLCENLDRAAEERRRLGVVALVLLERERRAAEGHDRDEAQVELEVALVTLARQQDFLRSLGGAVVALAACGRCRCPGCLQARQMAVLVAELVC